jgi:hypothetical protein
MKCQQVADLCSKQISGVGGFMPSAASAQGDRDKPRSHWGASVHSAEAEQLDARTWLTQHPHLPTCVIHEDLSPARNGQHTLRVSLRRCAVAAATSRRDAGCSAPRLPGTPTKLCRLGSVDHHLQIHFNNCKTFRSP